MGSQRLITIGLPVYNAMPYLPEAMGSLLDQTDSSFEILAIVDGATDASLPYLQSIRDARLRVLTQPNRGLTFTLNRMLRECRTPWLVRQDADDVSYPNRIERLRSAIAAAPQAGMFYSLANYHPQGRAVGSFRCTRGTPEQLRAIVREGYLPAICHPTVALDVEKTLRIGGYRLGLHNEDADLWWRMALAYEIHCIPEALAGFRQNEGSVSTCHFTAQAAAGLYVQYLLLSYLSRRTPQSFEVVQKTLETLLSNGQLRAKQHLRRFNMSLAQRKYLRAGISLTRSLLASPAYLLHRIHDEFKPSPLLKNGIPPHCFYEQGEALWQEPHIEPHPRSFQKRLTVSSSMDSPSTVSP